MQSLYGQWYLQNPNPFGYNLNDICFFSENRVVMAGGFGNIFLSIDGGINWEIIDSPVNYSLNSIVSLDSLTGIIAGDFGAILKTYDGGYTWTIINGGAYLNFKKIFFINDETGFVAGHAGWFMKSDNGGESWNGQFINDNYDFNSVYFYDELTGWVVGRTNSGPTHGIIMHTDDGGVNWSTDSLFYGYYTYLHDIYFTSQNNGWALGNGLYKTSDAGQTWIAQSCFFLLGYKKNLIVWAQGLYRRS